MRIRTLTAATTVVLAALSLTGCAEDEPLRSEGTPAPSASSSAQGAQGAQDAQDAQGAQSVQGAKDDGASARPDLGKSPDSHSTGAPDGTANRADCTTATTSVAATTVPRPVNTLLLTITNTGKKSCDLKNYPYLKFTGAQSVPPPIESSKPQAVVTLAPGATGYAAVRLSAADGSGGNGHRATTLEVGLRKDDFGQVQLPSGGVHLDDTLTVTYWQSTSDDALMH